MIIHLNFQTFLTIGQHPLDGPGIGRVRDSGFSQSPFPFGGLAGQNMAAKGLGTDNFPCSCCFKSLGSPSFRFNLGHSHLLTGFFFYPGRIRDQPNPNLK